MRNTAVQDKRNDIKSKVDEVKDDKMKGLFQKSMLLEEFQKVAEMISTIDVKSMLMFGKVPLIHELKFKLNLPSSGYFSLFKCEYTFAIFGHLVQKEVSLIFL